MTRIVLRSTWAIAWLAFGLAGCGGGDALATVSPPTGIPVATQVVVVPAK